MAIEIREGIDADLDAIVAAHNAAWRRAYRDLFPEDYLDGPELLKRQRSDWRRRFSPGGLTYPVRVAEVDGKVIGFCSYEPDDDDESVEMTALYVQPFHWSTGVGSALQRDARDRWRADGLTNAYLWTAAENVRAHRSYKKNGWVVSEQTKKQDIDGHKIPVVKLTLAL